MLDSNGDSMSLEQFEVVVELNMKLDTEDLSGPVAAQPVDIADHRHRTGKIDNRCALSFVQLAVQQQVDGLAADAQGVIEDVSANRKTEDRVQPVQAQTRQTQRGQSRDVGGQIRGVMQRVSANRG